MKIDLSDKTALVSGSTAGIGYAIAKGLAATGAKVVINGRKPETVEKAAARSTPRSGATCVRGVAADLSTAAGCDQLVKGAGPVDILVNNAGIFEPKAFFDIPDPDWTRFFEVNVMSGRAPLARSHARHAREELGTYRLHLLRVRAEHPEGNDPLRLHQNSAALDRPRPGADDKRAPA